MAKSIKLVTVDTDYEEIKVIAKKLDIAYSKTSKEELVERVNRKIYQAKGNKNPKWYELIDCFYKEGDKIEITEGHLKGRTAIVNKPSSKKHSVKVFLVNEQTGELQGTVNLKYEQIRIATEELKEKIQEIKQTVTTA